jgi:pyruvate/2-oxoglutarate dehydrogenase complex dihydrolipoamide dehydrogenase (E3) component
VRTNVPHIFAIGEIVGQPMLAHKAVHEGHVAAEVIAGELQGSKVLAAAAYTRATKALPSRCLTIHPHPTLGESIGMAAEIAHGSCTDVPPARK